MIVGSRLPFRPEWRSLPTSRFVTDRPDLDKFPFAVHKLRTQSKGTTGSRTSSRFARFIHASFARTLSESILCNQHYSEPRFALHHASVSISGLFERRCLDHWADIR